MKNIIILMAAIFYFASCSKEVTDTPPNFSMVGYWNVLKDTTFTATAANATADLYHLFKGEHVYYRFSFPKTQNFADLTAKPRADSLISFYQIKGDMLMIPNPAPSTTNIVPGNVLVNQASDQMKFIRTVIVKRNAITAEIEKTRTDTIKYIRVTDPIKIAWFDNYLKKWHP